MRKTTYRFDWLNGYTVAKRLSRSFDSIEEASRFAKDKTNADIFRCKGKFKVEWTKLEAKE